MLRVNEPRFLVQHESCQFKFRLNENVYNTKQKWNHDKFQCQCKELADWSSCKGDLMWNLSTCDCEGDKAFKIVEYLNIKNCLCKKLLFNNLLLASEVEILNTIKT